MIRPASLFGPLAVVLLACLAPVGALAGDGQEARAGAGPEAQTPAEPVVSQETPEIPREDLKEKDRVLTGSDLVDDDFPGSWPMFGQNTRMKVVGYVQANHLYDFDGSLDRRQFLMSTIPVQGTPEYDNRGYSSFLAADSRVNFDVRRIDAGKQRGVGHIEHMGWHRAPDCYSYRRAGHAGVRRPPTMRLRGAAVDTPRCDQLDRSRFD